MLTLNQLTYLQNLLLKDPWVVERYKTDWDSVKEAFETLTEGQKKYLIALLYNKKYKELDKFFTQESLPIIIKS